MKNKIISILLIFVLFVVLVVPAFAVTQYELKENIESCKLTKDTCHQMAECARKLGFAEDHVIIQIAKERWSQVNAQQLEYQKQLDELTSRPSAPATTWNGSKLTRSMGVNYGPIGKETYYNLNMSGVINIMRNRGYDSTNYPYWIRNDGCKMLGPYIMLAANFNHFPRGSIVECSLGWGLVCDTGYLGYNQLDIAVNW